MEKKGGDRFEGRHGVVVDGMTRGEWDGGWSVREEKEDGKGEKEGRGVEKVRVDLDEMMKGGVGGVRNSVGRGEAWEE